MARDVMTPQPLGGMRVRFSPHAIERLLDMQLDDRAATIRACLLDPDQVEDDKKRPGRIHYRHGCLDLVLDKDKKHPGAVVVVTAQWRDRKHWHADLSRGDYDGRHLTHDERMLLDSLMKG